jgi:hypothetical protein
MKRAKKKSASGEQQRDSSLILVWWRPGSKPGMHGRRKPLLLFIEKPLFLVDSDSGTRWR